MDEAKGGPQSQSQSQSLDMQHPQKPRKVKRISKACDFCHNRSIRCSASADDQNRCQSCVEYDQACSYDRPTKKRGAKSSKGKEKGSPTAPSESASSTVPGPTPRATWQAQPVASQAMIVDLVEIYFEVIYPIYPLFHRPSLTYRVSRGDFNTHRPFYAAVMALCALSSARVRDGALYSNRWDSRTLANPHSSIFFSAAEEAIPKDYSAAHDLDYLRAYALLSIAALQNNQITKMLYFLGTYDMLIKCDGLHDEKSWPLPMSVIEKEERRRLFWAMYSFEVYSAAVWGSVVSCREAQSNVHYPAEVDDDFLSQTNEETSSRGRSSSSSEMSLAYTLNNWGGVSGPVSWLQGWNFATDLYRVLEHAIDGFRSRSPDTDHTKMVAEIWKMTLPLQSNVLDAMTLKYQALPTRFKQTLPISLDPTQDRFSFQSANIAATIQLVRMTLITSAEEAADERCQVLNELIHTFANVPVAYLRAMSTPILHHLAGIGTILEAVFEVPVSHATYTQVRNVIIALADLLASLESGMGSAAGASDRLRSQVHRMDGHMQTQLMGQHNQMSNSQPQQHPSAQYQGQGPTAFPPLANPGHPGYEHQQHQQRHQQQQQQLHHQQLQQQQQQMMLNPNSQYRFPPEVFDEWNWAFDFTQSRR